MYYLGLCELQGPLHGGQQTGNYLLIEKFTNFTSGPIEEEEEESTTDSEQEEEEEVQENIQEIAEWYNAMYQQRYFDSQHPLIRNYLAIVSRPNYIKPEIMEVITLLTGETVVILKTVWIRIFQRKWRSNFAKLMTKLKDIRNIMNCRLTGRLAGRPRA